MKTQSNSSKYNSNRSKPINIPKRNILPVDSKSNQNTILPANTNTNNNSFLSNVKDGIALGIGANIGERITSMIFGPRKIQIENKNIDCNLEEYKDYSECKKV